MRWVWMAVSMLGFGLAWQAATPGLLGLGLLFGFGGLTAAVLSLAAARVQERSRPDSMMISLEELSQMRREAKPAAPPAAPRPQIAPRPLPTRPVPPANRDSVR